MSLTLLQEKSSIPEILPRTSLIVSLLFFCSAIAVSIVYGIDWWKPTINTQNIDVTDVCSPIVFKCYGCTDQDGCTIIASGINTINANRQLNISDTHFIYINTGETVTLNLCSGSNESLMLSLNAVIDYGDGP
jgi:hypothetical protein